MLCKDCLNWKRNEDGYIYLGECSSEKFVNHGDHSESLLDETPTDGVAYGDYEDYEGWLRTGENFGCIHFLEKR